MQLAVRWNKRQRFLLVLPLIVAPFLVLIFWVLGGGSGEEEVAVRESNGLNMHLPDARVSSVSALDKLSFYTMARQDSLKRIELEQLDPNYHGKVADEEDFAIETYVSPKVYQPAYRSPVVYENDPPKVSGNLGQLEEMIQSLQKPRSDPDMEALNQTLQQLIALQEPKTVVPSSVSSNPAYAVKAAQHAATAGFYGESELFPDTVSGSFIKAVIHGEQFVQQGSVVKLRLLEDIIIQHEKIAAGTFLFGLASLENERLQVVIKSIPFKGQLFPVSLQVMDLDGIEGIHIPGSIEREVLKQAAEQSVQSMGVLGVGQSLSSQVAAAGIGTAKNILGRKARQVRVTIKSGYQVLLKDEKRREQ